MPIGELFPYYDYVLTRGLLAFNNPFEDAGLSGGRIVFDYDGRTYRFGTGISWDEAEHLVQVLKRYLGPAALAPVPPAEVTSRRASVHDLGDTLEISVPGWHQRASRVVFIVWLFLWSPVFFLLSAARLYFAPEILGYPNFPGLPLPPF